MSILLKNTLAVNEGQIIETDILIEKGRFQKIAKGIRSIAEQTIDLKDEMYLLPGIIDDQVHFREPGLTHKAEIATESRAAIAGGVTSFMEMPNTLPPTLTQELLQEKYNRAAAVSPCNYSFYMGVSNDNYDEVMKTDRQTVCGIKIFMGSSTGNLLVDNSQILEKIFSGTETLIATHCEDEETIKRNTILFREKYGENMSTGKHAEIRSAEACFLSSSKAIELAQKFGTRLHILHVSTATEVKLFENNIPLTQKKITSEACVHHLFFDDSDYEKLGNKIKWNPSIKTKNDRNEIIQGLRQNYIDVIATDHAPHTQDEKNQSYLKSPSGGPLIQHGLQALWFQRNENNFDLPFLVKKMSHAPADCFQISDRGYLREGYFADCFIFNPGIKQTILPQNIRSKCGWSPFENITFDSAITHTIVNGILIYSEQKFISNQQGMRLKFNR